MRLQIPLTGTILEYHPELAKFGGSSGISGDPNDGVRPVTIDLGNVSWKLVCIDLVNETMEIEVTPSEEIEEDTGEKDGEGKPIYHRRKATELEKAAFLEYARNLIEGHTKEELYSISKCPKLKRGIK